MDNHEQRQRNGHDRDLFKEISDEEMQRLLFEVQEEALQQGEGEEDNLSAKSRRPFPQWIFWLIAVAMLVNILAFFPQTFSLPAIKFLITSSKLSSQENIQTYNRAVVVISTAESKGTGFSISSEGLILTNHHVIEGKERVTVDFPHEGLYLADVLKTYPAVDLAVLKVDGDDEDLPYLNIAEQTVFTKHEPIYVIGNPLSFRGIANEGEVLDYVELDSWEKEVIMIDAPIYRGSSGSPIINQQGEVIAIVFATLNHKEHGKIGLAIPIDYYLEN